MSLANTVVVLNQWRRIRGLGPISYGCLQRFVSRSKVMVLDKRETIKAGSKDEGTAWAWARCQFAQQQLKRQLRKGARIAAGGPAYVAADDGDDPAQAALELPIFRGAVVFADEVRGAHPQGRVGEDRAAREGRRAQAQEQEDDAEVQQGGARAVHGCRGEGPGGRRRGRGGVGATGATARRPRRGPTTGEGCRR